MREHLAENLNDDLEHLNTFNELTHRHKTLGTSFHSLEQKLAGGKIGLLRENAPHEMDEYFVKMRNELHSIGQDILSISRLLKTMPAIPVQARREVKIYLNQLRTIQGIFDSLLTTHPGFLQKDAEGATLANLDVRKARDFIDALQKIHVMGNELRQLITIAPAQRPQRSDNAFPAH